VVYLAGVSATADAPRLDAFRQALRDHGYIEGQNILIETRHEGRDLDRLPEHAAELVGQKPQVFVAVMTNAALAAKKSRCRSYSRRLYRCDRPRDGGPSRKPGSTRSERDGYHQHRGNSYRQTFGVAQEIVPKVSHVACYGIMKASKWPASSSATLLDGSQ